MRPITHGKLPWLSPYSKEKQKNTVESTREKLQIQTLQLERLKNSAIICEITME